MEGKLTSPRRTMEGGRAGRGSQTLDLRQQAAAAANAAYKQAAAPRSAAPVRKPVAVRPEPATAAPAATPAAPKPSPLQSKQPAPEVAPVGPNVGQPTAPVYEDAAFANDRRFWPAFWRFLVLLAILGALVVGSLYVYFNYLRT